MTIEIKKNHLNEREFFFFQNSKIGLVKLLSCKAEFKK